MRAPFPSALGAVAAALLLGCGGPGEGEPTRYRPDAVDLIGLQGIPQSMASPPTAIGRYLVHAPVANGEAFAEIAFAVTDGDEMAVMEYGVPGAATQWLRFGLVQAVEAWPLGTRYLDDFSHLRIDGVIDGIEYRGTSTEVDVRTDLATGAIDGHISAQVMALDHAGPTLEVRAYVSGRLERRCVHHIYRPELDVDYLDPAVKPTGSDCGWVFDAIDAAPTDPDGVQVPPAFDPGPIGTLVE